MTGPNVDGVLVTWGERLFYPGNRIVRAPPLPRLDTMLRRKATVIRSRIEAVVRRAPQAMVKVTGGGRGMGAIAAHFRYISKNGRLVIEDERGVQRSGKDDRKLAEHVAQFVQEMPAVRELLRQRQYHLQPERQQQQQPPRDRQVGKAEPGISR